MELNNFWILRLKKHSRMEGSYVPVENVHIQIFLL